jgi:hypothetical protein
VWGSNPPDATSHCRLRRRQRRPTVDLDAARARELFRLNDLEIARIQDLQPRRQFLVKYPNASKVLELTVDSRASWIYSNTPLA